MPHLILEYSANVDYPSDLTGLFEQLHEILSEAGIRPENCKSRARVVDDYLVALGRESDAFVHLEIRVFEGRPPETIVAIGEAMRGKLVAWFHDSVERLDLQITAEIVEMRRAFYFKYPE